jgi:hypothetical protein
MSTSNQDAVAQMVETITLVTSSDQIKGMSESALEAIDGGAGGSKVANDLEAASQAIGLADNAGGKVGTIAQGVSGALDLASKATNFIDEHPAIGKAAKTVATDVGHALKSIF